MKHSNEPMQVNIDNEVICGLYDPADPFSVNLVNAKGHTGAVTYTLHGEDIRSGRENCSAYAEHCSAAEPLQGLRVRYQTDRVGVHIDAAAENDAVSQFGILLDMNMMSMPGTPFEHQYLPSSPYTSPDGSICYCIFTRPDGRCLVAAAESAVDGWKIRYSPEAFGHFIRSFSFLASFDDAYSGSGRKHLRVVLSAVGSIDAAYEKIGEIYGLPYAIPVTSGGFGAPVTVRVSKGVNTVEVSDGTGWRQTVPVLNGYADIRLKNYGFAVVAPLMDEQKGIPAVIWNGMNMEECLRRAVLSIRQPYHGDDNLCEGGCWNWFLLRYMYFTGEMLRCEEVQDDLKTIMGEQEPFVEHRSIVPFAQEQYLPYHIWHSDRVQEQFFGVSILLDAFRALKDRTYLNHAVCALDELLDNWVTSEGMITGLGKDYTTVTCPVIPIVDMARCLRGDDPERAEYYKGIAIRIADYVVRRGLDFPTEGEDTDLTEMEDGSISCSALTVLYVAVYLEKKPAYLDFAKKILKLHEAWTMHSPDARMLGSSFRWWETIWEGDATGPNICAGHAWTIWRSEAMFWLGILTGDAGALIDSWNGFITNFSKQKETGEMYSCYIPDYITGGGIDGVRETLRTAPQLEHLERFRIVHGYPELPDHSLSRYAWIRAYDTWLISAAVLKFDDRTVCIRCRIDRGRIIAEPLVQVVYLSSGIAEQNLQTDLPTVELPSDATI